MSRSPILETAPEPFEGWISVTERLPAIDVTVLVRQDRWAPCHAWRTERDGWKFIEYQHPHHVTHWRHK